MRACKVARSYLCHLCTFRGRCSTQIPCLSPSQGVRQCSFLSIPRQSQVCLLHHPCLRRRSPLHHPRLSHSSNFGSVLGYSTLEEAIELVAIIRVRTLDDQTFLPSFLPFTRRGHPYQGLHGGRRNCQLKAFAAITNSVAAGNAAEVVVAAVLACIKR